MIQLSVVAACTWVRGTCRSYSTKWCGQLMVGNSSHWFKQLSNP